MRTKRTEIETKRDITKLVEEKLENFNSKGRYLSRGLSNSLSDIVICSVKYMEEHGMVMKMGYL
jgi:hypothetical protein